MSLDDMAAMFVHRLQDKFLGRNIFPRIRGGRPRAGLDKDGPDSQVHERDAALRMDNPDPRDLKRSQDYLQTSSAKRPCEDCRHELAALSHAVEEPPQESLLNYSDQGSGHDGANNVLNELVETPLDYEAEQEIRNTRYCTFEPEESPEDYTDGPCRWTFGQDGVKDCAVLLMPYHLSQRIQGVALEQRQYARKERQIIKQLAQIAKFLSTAKVEIRIHRYKLQECAESNEQSDEEATFAKPRLANELQVMEDMLEHYEAEKIELEGKLRRLGDYLRESYTELMVELDEAFTSAKLLEPQNQDELPVERLDLQEQYQKFRARDQGTEEGRMTTPPPPIDTSRDFLMNNPPTLTPEQQRISALQQAAQQALTRFEIAGREFDLRMLNQEQERAFNQDAWLHGTHAVDVDTAAFDARWLWLNHTITRELIEAEDAVRAARKEAKAGGIDVLSLAPSLFPSEGFESHPQDGKCWSGSDLSEVNGERPVSTSAKPRVWEWLGSVGEEFTAVGDAGSGCAMDVDVDDWVAKEVEFWDSASLAEERTEKRKLIDKWQQMCSAEREQLAA
ncbi:hypothetical protein CERZMDRAFT_95312 [Cercospora zeae-maydis SCOH1-5]|uniref:Uncharacterized protein n=1 Tax=Cercospora zeae-maydis SCOH1-5 TaxID=717836 RepID=A0A6A6FNP4_9PEZI|nr:hypothetical protein CERZMDRAFT_95312 [Cercospora zeae-maydis SCOH1-5]